MMQPASFESTLRDRILGALAGRDLTSAELLVATHEPRDYLVYEKLRQMLDAKQVARSLVDNPAPPRRKVWQYRRLP